jgi:murein DD-endopeptidase MepM/ murein hydrolase activator NlpD
MKQLYTSACHLLFRFGRVAAILTVGVAAAAAAPNGAPMDSPTGPLPSETPAVAAPAAPVLAPAAAPPAPKPEKVLFNSPLPGRAINSRFGHRKLSGEAARAHQGVDIAAPTGVKVLAAAGGVVTAAGRDEGYGNYVEIRHANGLRSFYAHLSRIDPSVRAGARVTGGATVGRVGSTGHSTGPHLHFEVRQSGRRLDPAKYLNRPLRQA